MAISSVAGRAAVIDAMQRGHTGKAEERAIRDIFLATHGADLAALKNAIDLGSDYHDLPQLIFHDIDDNGIRNAIVQHIQREAARTPGGTRKVMSDIDDTFYANYKDARYPKKTVYPGVRQFYRELGRSPAGDPPEVGPVFITARPDVREGVVENLTQKTLRDHGIDTGVVLTGDLTHLVGNSAIADKKYENFNGYQQLYPENNFVFVGDSGQGDALLGDHLRAQNADRVDAAFIHDVNQPPLGAADRARWAQKGVYFFDTYVGAATAAFQHGLIDAGALRRVIAVTQTEMDAVSFSSDSQRADRQADLARDISAAQAAIAAAG